MASSPWIPNRLRGSWHVISWSVNRRWPLSARYADTRRATAGDNDHLTGLLAVWDNLQRLCATQRLPSLIAAMRLALEVYDSFGSGMVRLDDPIEAGIWDNMYLVWEREVRVAKAEPAESRAGSANTTRTVARTAHPSHIGSTAKSWCRLGRRGVSHAERSCHWKQLA